MTTEEQIDKSYINLAKQRGELDEVPSFNFRVPEWTTSVKQRSEREEYRDAGFTKLLARAS